MYSIDLMGASQKKVLVWKMESSDPLPSSTEEMKGNTLTATLQGVGGRGAGSLWFDHQKKILFCVSSLMKIGGGGSERAILSKLQF